jgi:hypothetical protein
MVIGIGPGTTIRVVEPAIEMIRVVEPDLGLEVGREGFRDRLSLKDEPYLAWVEICQKDL